MKFMSTIRRWLRSWVKSFLFEEDDNFLEVRIDDTVERVDAYQTVGSYLMCLRQDGNRLVHVAQAVSPDRFVTLWHRLSGHQAVTWPDGSPYNPFSSSNGPF